MHFTVAYSPTASDELAIIWLSATNAQDVANASNYIDRLLRFSADKLGVDFESFRRLRVMPLELDFTVSVDDCYVEVKHVRLIAS